VVEASTHQRGKEWEDRAAAYLRRRAYRVVERNYRTPLGEIDLIVARGAVLAFVEVKGRRSAKKGKPLEAISPPKVRRVCAAAALSLASNPTGFSTYRFDVVPVGPERGGWGGLKVRHLEDAFRPEGSFNV